MKTYLINTKFNTYKYQRRVPKQLVKYINSSMFRISLGKDELEANTKALEFNSTIDEAIKLIDMNIADDVVLSQLGELVTNTLHLKKPLEHNQEGLFLDVVNTYLQSLPNTLETVNKEYFYTKVCPYVFKQIGCSFNPVIDDIKYEDLLKFKSIIIQLPKKTLLKYRSMEVLQIIKILGDVLDCDKLSAVTVNKYIKWLRTLFNFALVRGLLSINLAKAIPTVQTIDEKLQRLPLSNNECELIHSNLTNGRYHHKVQSIEKQYLFLVLKYTGMRLSELYKCEVDTIEGVLCFTLLDRSIKLKTKSSYRIIPIHSSLLSDVNNFYNYRNFITSINISISTNKLIKKLNLDDADKKSLYSLRHSFATELIQKGASNILVSQLLGHSLASIGGMTMTRYANGANIQQLKEVIDML